MKSLCVLLIFVICLFAVARSRPADSKNALDQSKSAFGPAFDEIVVESSLTVRRKTDPGRQARNQDVTQGVVAAGKREKRQANGPKKNPGSIFPGLPAFPAFPSAAAAQAGAQAQDFNVKGPLSGFGAGSAGTQTQTLALGKSGIAGSGAFGLSQQYRLPDGKVVDFTINNSFGATNGALAKGSGSSLSISNPGQPIAAGK